MHFIKLMGLEVNLSVASCHDCIKLLDWFGMKNGIAFHTITKAFIQSVFEIWKYEETDIVNETCLVAKV